MLLTKEQLAERSRIIGQDTSGDYVRVGFYKIRMLKALQAAGFLDPEERQNDSPTIAEFMAFMEEHPAVYAHGYTIGGTRDDGRVSVEGLACSADAVTIELLRDFVGLCRYADELDVKDNLRSWWD